jgi:hypothetical protein
MGGFFHAHAFERTRPPTRISQAFADGASERAPIRGNFLQTRFSRSPKPLAMLCDETTHLWLGRFCVRLMQLRGSMSLREAVSRAVAAHGRFADMIPEDAAQLDAAVATWRLPLPLAMRGFSAQV